MKLRDRTVAEFSALIASTAPAPGGGGASAAVAALGIALGDMVGEFTVGKKKYAEVEDEIRALMVRAQEIRLRLLELIDEDDENFTPLSKAYGIPKDAPGRDEELERCLRLAAKTPMEIFNLCCEVIVIQNEFARKGSKLMISDAATGVQLAKAAMYGAAVNVKVNTALMHDSEYAEELNSIIDSKFDEYSLLADSVFHFVYDGLEK